ncbi:MAG: peptidase C11 [Firmicutes bacterium]|nr:peptidase C11 [Bacillota bacterium]
MENRPAGRKKHVTGEGSGLNRRGSGLNSGPAGGHRGSRRGSSAGKRAAAGGGGLITIIILIIMALSGGGNGLLTGSNGGGQGSGAQGGAGSSIFSMLSSGVGSWKDGLKNTGVLDDSIADGSRSKYTNILGGGRDKITMMVYLCGTDLEQKHGMASNDLREMASADLSDNVNIIVYTGGCTGWKTSAIDNRTNQIYQVKDGKLITLSANEGDKSMTDPSTLAGFIKWTAANYPANRYELVMWDHGGGSVTGFGYDQKHSGSMTLEGIDSALNAGGVKFDFIGFDACLMATAENAIMLSKYGDYLIASEETEPGVGWYYTNWLTSLSKNTSMPTVEIGKNICDDFVNVCAQQCRGQKTTLSVVDLAEVQNTLPGALSEFSRSTAQLISDKQYRTVSAARSGSREFAPSSQIDQVDLANLAANMETQEGTALTNAVLGAVKYNKTSDNMTNACGLSIYFPYRSASKISKITDIYRKIGINDEYTRCIQNFAKMETGGQVAAGGTADPLGTLLGQAAQSQQSQDMITQLLSGLASNAIGSVQGIDAANSGFLSDRSLVSDEEMTDYILNNSISDADIVWSDGNKIVLSEQQWKLIEKVDKNTFVDDGNGFIDLGLDNVYSFDEDGNLIADDSDTWLAINGQVVAYYHTDTAEENGQTVITGYIPVLLNGERAKLIAVFEGEESNGYIAGAEIDYSGTDTEVTGKNLTEIKKGDTIDFICDYYNYNGEYLDSYLLGEQMTVDGKLEISDVTNTDKKMRITYLFTDIYNNKHWSPVMQ